MHPLAIFTAAVLGAFGLVRLAHRRRAPAPAPEDAPDDPPPPPPRGAGDLPDVDDPPPEGGES